MREHPVATERSVKRVQNFTDMSIRSLPPGTHFDPKTPAFGIRVGKKRRTWLVVKGPRERRVQTIIGHYPSLTLQDARKRALVLLGTDSPHNASVGFPRAVELFLEAHGPKLRPSSRYQLEGSFRRHFPWTKPLDKITHEDVAREIDSIEAKSEASHALKDLKTFFNWCVPRYLKHSPCEGIKAPQKYSPRQRLLTDDEIRRIWKASEGLGQYGVQIRLLVCTGQRWNQIASLRRSWVMSDTVQFPAQVMKGGRDHTIPIGPLTAELLKEAKGTDLLFPARGVNKPNTSQGKVKKKLDTLCGVTDFVVHDFRRYVASSMAKQGVALSTIEKYLSHRSGSFSGIVSVYQLHSFLPEMREASLRYETMLQELVR